MCIRDRPSIGLHQRDNAQLIATLKHLRDICLLYTSSRTVQNWENEVSMPSLDNLLKLCSVFQTTPNVLLGFSTHAVLVLDDLPREDQAVMKGIYQLLWSKSHRIRR